jgi:hypothetical protein
LVIDEATPQPAQKYEVREKHEVREMSDERKLLF